MTNSPHGDTPWSDQTLEQLEAERDYYQRMVDGGTNLVAAYTFLASIKSWIEYRKRR